MMPRACPGLAALACPVPGGGGGGARIARDPLPPGGAQATDFNAAVLSRCPTLAAEYTCTPFFTNGHMETILAAKLRRCVVWGWAPCRAAGACMAGAAVARRPAWGPAAHPVAAPSGGI